MKNPGRVRGMLALAAVTLWLAAAGGTAKAQVDAQGIGPGGPGVFINCIATEVHPNAQPGTTLLLFNAQNRGDSQRFASLLARADGSYVQVQSRNGRWVSAPVVRLQNCSGRGLLLFPNGAMRLRDYDPITVKFGPSGPGYGPGPR